MNTNYAFNDEPRCLNSLGPVLSLLFLLGSCLESRSTQMSTLFLTRAGVVLLFGGRGRRLWLHVQFFLAFQFGPASKGVRVWVL